eukprot:gene8929-16557_t
MTYSVIGGLLRILASYKDEEYYNLVTVDDDGETMNYPGWKQAESVALYKACDGEEVYSIDDNDDEDDVESEGDNGTTELIETREQFEVKCASRGFYQYRKFWMLKLDEKLEVVHERGNVYDPYGRSTDIARLKISRQYRSVLQSCIVELQRKLSKEDNFEDEEMKYQLELLAIVEMFWHLCEIILIDTKPGGYCITVLLEWVRWHFTKADRLAEQVLFSDDPSSHESFWPAILGYVLQGRMTEAMKLLQHFADDSEAAFKAVKSMEELMKSMPEFQGFTGQYVQDFNQKWYHWRNECEGRLEDGEFSEHPHLESISKIFCGQESAIEENSDLCQSWYEILIAKLLYTEATIKKTDLHSRSLSAVEAIGGYAALSPLDEVVLAILNFDVHRMIRKCSECLPNWWFVAHITDLLHHCGMLKEHDFGLWQVAADYLSTCPTQGSLYRSLNSIWSSFQICLTFYPILLQSPSSEILIHGDFNIHNLALSAYSPVLTNAADFDAELLLATVEDLIQPVTEPRGIPHCVGDKANEPELVLT